MRRREKAVPRGTYNMTPIFIESAHGAILIDVDGNEYLDFAGGIGCLNVGSTPAEVCGEIKDQVDQFLHTCFHVTPHEPYVALAERLNSLTPGDFPKKTFFANSGVEAVENAVKIARSYTRRPGVVVFEDAFHGRTLLGMSLTSKIHPYKNGFGPFAPEVYRLPYAYCYRCAYSLTYPGCKLRCAAPAFEDFFKRYVNPDSVACIIVEPVLGEGGFVVPPAGFLRQVEQVCRKYKIVFVADEVQTGIGRTGTLFASERFGIEPDILLSAKSLGAGLPLSSITGRSEIMDQPGPGGLGGTYGGNPVACRAALAALDLIQEKNLCARAVKIGKKVMVRFESFKKKFQVVGNTRGLGAMCALELVKDRKTKAPNKEAAEAFSREALQLGLVTLTAGTYGNVIRTLMPLVITDKELDAGLDRFEKALSKITS